MLDYIEITADDVRFAADCHFSSPSAPGEKQRRERFMRFLAALPPGVVLFLLGDIFDFYFEYRSVVSNKYLDLFGALADCRTRGVNIHFLGGNHDYWVGDFVERDLGITLHKNEVAVAAQGRKIVCAHGDLVMPWDPGYKIFKTVTRNRAVIGLSKWIHPDVLDAIAAFISAGSRKVKKSSQEKTAKRLAGTAHDRFFGRGNDVFIMGHVHYPYHVSNGAKEFLIVGDWVINFTYGRLQGGKLSIEEFTDPSKD